MEHACIKEEKTCTAFGQLHRMQHSWHGYMVIYTDTDHTYKLNCQISPQLHMCIAQ